MKSNLPRLILAFTILNVSFVKYTAAFNLGVGATKCNLDPSKGTVNDNCKSLYNAECDGSNCRCPGGYSEDKALSNCVKGGSKSSAGGGVGLFDDLPLDYDPKKKPGQPQIPAVVPPPVGGGNNNNYPRQPQPGLYPTTPRPYNPYPPVKPYDPNRPGQSVPGYQPGPGQPGYNPHGDNYPKQPKTKGGSHYPVDNKVGEKAGGGVGGLLGILIIGALIYFCCCRGGKHKEVMGKFQGLPFMKGRGGGAAAATAAGGVPPEQGGFPMQSGHQQHDPNFSSQHTYIPPDQMGGMQPGMQPYPPQGPPPPGAPYPGMPPPGQYPPMGPPQGQGPPMGPPQGPMPYPTQMNYSMANPTSEASPGQPQAPPPYTEQYQPNAPPQP